MKKLIAGMLMMAPLAAFAHAHLERSSPANDAKLKTSPDHVVLVFNEAVGLNAVTLQKDGEKSPTALGPLPQEEGVALQVALPKLSRGRYTVRYVVVSSDQHESRGALVFTVQAP